MPAFPGLFAQGAGAGRGAAQRLDRVMQLAILDALFLEFVGGPLATRIGQLVAFASGIVESRFVYQMPAPVRFPQRILAAIFPVGIGKLWPGNVRLDSATT